MRARRCIMLSLISTCHRQRQHPVMLDAQLRQHWIISLLTEIAICYLLQSSVCLAYYHATCIARGSDAAVPACRSGLLPV